MTEFNLSHAKKVGTTDDGVRLISKPEVLERVGVTFPTLWAWMREGKFPAARDLGSRPAWIESEIEAWILTRPVRQYKQADAT